MEFVGAIGDGAVRAGSTRASGPGGDPTGLAPRELSSIPRGRNTTQQWVADLFGAIGCDIEATIVGRRADPPCPGIPHLVLRADPMALSPACRSDRHRLPCLLM